MAGIYIHIPFCKQACHYCNFHFSTNHSQKAAMVEAICKEIILTPVFDKNEFIETIYFGGGTPSLLSMPELEKILNTIRQKFSIVTDAEITLEANPDDINPTVLQAWLQAGINRLSLGIQSFNEAELKWMNRAHHAAQSLQSIDQIQAAGFQNFSVDLIYGSPLLSNDDLIKNVGIIFEKNIPHISCYALTVEYKTALYYLIDKNKSPNVDESIQADQFEILQALMNKNGYEQYEISNFAKPGYRSKHNSSYWKSKPYYGFGPSAHSYDGNKTRRWNVANNALYIQSIEKNILPQEEEILTPAQQMNEYIMIGLRTIEG
ncbi:MAG TPA: radical SAM family heme chaperone HemW, partial [Ferruginibacter sp.]|nr:radical SAM family heme chaperone HemW [Ferruginibacter sp.]